MSALPAARQREAAACLRAVDGLGAFENRPNGQWRRSCAMP